MRINGETEKKIEELLHRMTLHEKVGQLHQTAPSRVGGFEISEEEAENMLKAGHITEEEYETIVSHRAMYIHDEEIRRGEIGSFIGVMDRATANRLQKIAVEESRLGIPIIFGMDVIHGYKTIFPVPLAEACTFNEEIFENTARIAAKEASEDGINWTYAPMADVARDARWGRVAEGPGEDTYLASRFAAAKVRGFQGTDMREKDRIAACVKHFAAYGACEGGRDYDTVDMSLPKFYETYLPPYAAAVKEGCATVMAAFNDLSGVPCTTNGFLLKEVLRGQLGFKGMVISDADAIKECVNHGTAAHIKEAVKQSIEAGTEMDLGSNVYTAYLEQMVEEGEVDIQYVDDAVRDVLRVKFAVGLFDDPYGNQAQVSSFLCDEHRKAARDAARRSIVLLKNEENVLPLSQDAKIAVVGAAADDRGKMLGCWAFTGDGNQAVSLMDALKERELTVKYAACCGEDMPLNREQLMETVEGAEVIIAALEFVHSGEAQSCWDITLQGEQKEMLELLSKTGKKVVSVLFNGRPVAIPEVIEKSTAVVEAWNLGSEAGHGIVDVLLGEYNPSGRLAVTFPNASGECPVYYNHPNTGRPRSEEFWTSKYIDAPLKPLFPFGYGLSYTDYQYGPLSLEKTDEGIKATVKVTNNGKVDGEETVQLYIHRRQAERVRPVRELKGYKKVFLKAGESKDVSFLVEKNQLGYYNLKAEYVTTESWFDIWMAHDSSCGSHGEIKI